MQPAGSIDHHALAVSEMEAGNLVVALSHAQKAVATDGANVGYRETMAGVLYRMGDLHGVIAIYVAILKDQPQNLPALKRLTRLLIESWQFEKADAVVSQALAIDGSDVQLLLMQVFIMHELGHSTQARALAGAAAAMRTDVLSFAMDSHLLLPMVYADADEIGTCRKRYADGLESLHAAMSTWQDKAAQVFTLERSNFLLAYQGGDDRELQTRHAGFIHRLVETAAPELTRPLPLTFDGQRKLKIGFVSTWLHSSTAGNYFERWMTQLDSARFDRHIYYTGQGEDELTRRVANASDHFVRLQKGPQANGNRILADELDVLIHPEVGMSTGSYVLSAMRLAPVQMAAWGHPVTTGSEAIDYFLSCGAMEPEGHAVHYSEKVILLNGIGVDIPLPTMPPEGKKIERSSLGLPTDAQLYFCPQSLFKIHPNMDEILVKILEGDTRAVLVFFQAGSRAITHAFGGRLSGRLASAGIQAKGQIKFLPRLGGDMFRSALGLADVMLDTLHWSGGGTSLDAFAANTPVVSLPGAFMRGRQTAAMLRLMGLDSLIAGNIDDYVVKAIELATNRGMNDAIRETIAARKSNVFGRAEASAEFADRVYDAVTGKL